MRKERDEGAVRMMQSKQDDEVWKHVEWARGVGYETEGTGLEGNMP